jgi:hypothetical protein
MDEELILPHVDGQLLQLALCPGGGLCADAIAHATMTAAVALVLLPHGVRGGVLTCCSFHNGVLGGLGMLSSMSEPMVAHGLLGRHPPPE